MMSKCEAEIDAIRVKLYEETKDLTREERIKRANDKSQKLAAQFGFAFIPSAGGAGAKSNGVCNTDKLEMGYLVPCCEFNLGGNS